jgi:hypothetical protein
MTDRPQHDGRVITPVSRRPRPTSRSRRLPRLVDRDRLRAAGQLGWGLSDQALSSLTNFGLSLMVAREVGTSQLGAFSLVFTTYLMALGISRSLNSDPLMVRYSAGSERSWREGAALTGGGAIGLGVVGGAACALVGWAIGGSLGGAFVVLGFSLPGLLLQDAWRYAFIAAGRSFQAFLNDLVWAVVLAPALAVIVVTGRASLVVFELAWGGAATIAALVGVAQAGFLPWPANPLVWWRRHRDLNSRYLGEFLATGGVTQLNAYGVSAVAGLGAVGTLRAGELGFGPVHVLFMGGSMVAVAEGARIVRRSPARLAHATFLLSATLSVVTALWGAVLYLLPPTVGTQILGSTWHAAHSVAVPFTLVTVGLTASAGPQTGLRALAAARHGLRARLIAGPLTVGGTLTGALLGGAVGAAWGMAAGYWSGAAVWWWQYRIALQRHRIGTSPVPGAERRT